MKRSSTLVGFLAFTLLPITAMATSLSSYREAVVFITAVQVDADGSRRVKQSGTGVIVSESGHIVTAAHVLAEFGNSESTLVYYASIGSRHEKAYPIQVIKRDSELDVGLAKLPDLRTQPKVAKLRALERRDLDARVYILGFPGSSDLSSADGQLSSDFGPKGYWQTSLPMTFGNSGGPVLDTDDYVIGLAVGGTVDGRTYIIPANYLKGLLDLVSVPLLRPAREISTPTPTLIPAPTPQPTPAKAPPLPLPSKSPGPSCLDQKANLTIEEIRCACFGICPTAVKPTPVNPPASPIERRFDTYDGRDIDGHDLGKPLRRVELEGCVEACQAEGSCRAFSYDKWNKMCFMKDTIPETFRVEPNSVVAVPAKSTIKLSRAPIEIEKLSDALFVDKGFKELTNTSRDGCAAACERETRCQAFTFIRANNTCRLIEYPSEYFRKYLTDKRTANPKYVVEADSGVKRQKPAVQPQ